ncbi:MAG: bifunctional metallophosphatase/5'-nucleotidase [Clostridiales bacterium]|nr:bifunctional metallophosphatase/5'-nucleotidase [Clostridiales bacterium]
MKKLLALALALVMLFSVCAFAEEAAAPALAKDLVILYTSDVHCGVDQGWSYTGLYGIKQQLSASNYVMLVDDGDSIQGEALGAITKGEVDINLMNALGYDIAIPGNHEFDYGMDRFMDIVENQAQFPYISCNFTYMDEPVLAPYIIKDYDGVKIAFVGISTPETFTKSTPTFFQDGEGNYVYGFCQDLTGEKLYAAVQTAVDAARAEGAQYVIALAHLGIDEASSPWMSTQVIAATNGIDAMLDGHSHSIMAQEEVLNKDGEPVLLTACGTKLQAIGYCRISTDGKVSTGLYQWTLADGIVGLTGLTNEFSPIMAEQTDAVNAKLAEVVAHTDVDLIINDPTTGARIIRCCESNLGDLVADAYRDATGADVALVNGGGIRATIAAGDITLNQIKACHPFGNMLCMVEATGQQILDALEWTSRAVPGENGGFLQVSGLTYEIHSYLPSTCEKDENGMFVAVTGEYRVKNVMINGEPLDPERIYTVASHNYMLKSGGDGTCMFIGDTVLLDEVKYDYETVIDYIVDTLGGSVGEEYADLWGQDRIIVITEAP